MPSGEKFANVADYSKTQGGEVAADLALRKVVKIGSVSAGVQFECTIAGTPTVEIGNEVTINGAVTISGVANVKIDNTDPVTYAVTTISVTGATSIQLVAAQGASIGIRIHGFSIFNEGTNLRRFELRYDTTPIWRGSLASAGGGMNWNLIGRSLVGADNKALKLYVSGAATATVTVYWEQS